MEPKKLFDNLYVIGRTTTLIYVIETPEGLILIDTGYLNDVDSVLLAGLNKLKLDPTRIKYVIISHGHADHFGGAKYLQDKYGARIFLTSADWDYMERPPAAGAGPAVPLPKRDGVIVENQPIVLGQEKVTAVFLPGHTPGTVALIFSVKDRGQTHTVGYLGAPMLIPPPDPQVQQHINSLKHFSQIARNMKVDVELLNHPIMDGMPARVAALDTRAAGKPNPLVIGVDSYQRFLTVSSECLQSVLVRRAEKRSSGN
jgi:metallo-beta-lactamase class B